MTESLLFQTSLVAAFVAGLVALFAPCCITFLLPAYLGSVFRQREKVLLMTLVFGLGIFIVLLPAVLGIAFISKVLFAYHEFIYILGGVIMLAVAIISFFGLKLPMPHLSNKVEGKTDILSVFTLGIFSGITSACCAPVLIGVLAFTVLSPNFWWAIAVGAVYVLGMVSPLLFISLFLSYKMPGLSLFRKPLRTLKISGKEYPLMLGNLIASGIFFATGILTLFLVITGRLSMGKSDIVTKNIQKAGELVNSVVGGNVIFDILFIGAIGFLLYKIFRRI
ncbi:MAG: cytochrome c biogenesis protein CcdA [Candidatus Blackburnbacteria bacterium]|nr:cytochrome c biogenesis protein CcdA [Candidatus Blackburnbacteria bacterium]